VSVTGVDDDLVDGDQEVGIRLSVDAANSADEYDGVGDVIVQVTNEDDDDAEIVASRTSATVSEDGGQDAFTVRLSARPSEAVVLTVTSADEGEVTVAPATLTFEPDAWDEAQTVTLTGVDDALADGDQETEVRVAV